MEKKGNQHVHELDYVMVNEDANSSRGQSACATPLGTPMHGASPAKILDLMVPSPERFPSPRLHFATINAKSAAALEAVFGRDFDVTDHLGVQLIKGDGEERMRAVSEGAESLVSQSESPCLILTAPTKQLPPPAIADPKEEEASSGSPVSSLKTAASLKDRLAEALREIERLRAALEEANQQQEWVLGNVVKNSEAEKEELSRALQEMTASRDALELELKHNEKEFASLVTEELEQRFARFEDVTLAAVSKLSPTAASVGPPASAPYRTPTGPARIAPPAVPEGRVLGAPLQPSVRSNILMAHLGTVGPNMTLLEALQSRQATDALRAMDRAREPARPLDICLQARVRPTLAAADAPAILPPSSFGARLRSSRIARVFGAGAGAIRSAGQGSLRAIKSTPSALKASAAAVGSAVQHGAAAAGTRARSGAQGIAFAAAVSASWVQHFLTVSNAKHAIVQVPSVACKPFLLFGHISKQLSSFLHRKDVLEVLEMYWGITAASLLAVTTIFAGALFVECTREMICRPTFTAWEPKALTTMQQLADQVHTVEQKASTLEAETRRYDEALAAAMDETLRASKESLSSVLEAKRAMHDRVKAAERRAIRAEHAAKQARLAAAAHTAPDSGADAAGPEQPPLQQPGKATAAEDDVWRMDPEELFSWSGFPDIDLRSVVDKLRDHSCSAFRRPRD
ncbi:hypothetical protein WJX75_000090 [Coccomyxa subellipsoidea]|uniref:Uncharacterized protein n=1 Tax=Coccomyxa subellipsoidea TaxID=248742 RepID=A0ABR2YV43_9CHLO